MLQPAAADRIVDANLNRLAEGLRVIEDLCRFGLGETERARQLKGLRQESERLRRAYPANILAARDSAGDVGRERVAGPSRRSNPTEVLGAAFGRVKEALRSLEEMGKLHRPEAAQRAKALRYEVYDAEKVLVPKFDRARRMERLQGLYLILSDPPGGYEELARMAVEANVAAIQLRVKDQDSGPLLELARRLRRITADTATLFIVNDRPDIARLAEADGLHLGQTDLPVEEARRVTGPWTVIGKSTHNLRQMRAAQKERPDYVAVGPVFETGSKERTDRVLGLERAGRIRSEARVPVVAIGGITAEHVSGVMEAGYDSFAVIDAVSGASDPQAAIRKLKRLGQRGVVRGG